MWAVFFYQLERYFMKKLPLSFLFSSLAIASSMSYAETVNIRDAEQTKVETKAVSEQQINEDLLRQEQLVNTGEFTLSSQAKADLIKNPAELEQALVQSLISRNIKPLSQLVDIYKQVENRDESLIEWANAILAVNNDLNESVMLYRKLIAAFPDNPFIRYQLAETLFFNQEYEASKDQFEKIRATLSNEKDIEVVNRYIETIKAKDQWNFSFGATFLNDNNLSNSADQGTQMILPNGGTFTYDTPKQTGQGISAWLGANKQWTLSGGKYIKLDSGLSSKYYWDNKRYNDLNANVGLGFGYSTARFDVEFMPRIYKTWYAGGVNYGEALKQYSTNYGANLTTSYWLTKNLKYTFSYGFGYDKYDRLVNAKQYDGPSHSLTNALTYFPSAKQYWMVAADLSRKQAKDESNSYFRYGTRLVWGQEWPLGVSTSLSLGMAKRNYKEASFLGKQKNKEYSANISLWHKELHYAGFTPRLSWNYTKTSSNIPFYSYDKSQFMIDVNRTF